MKITETASPEDAISVLSRYFENPMVKLDKDGCMGMEGGKVFTVSVNANAGFAGLVVRQKGLGLFRRNDESSIAQLEPAVANI